ncbi:tRNA pseudouridine(38-40) synthase TruA [Candidatus Williamhamiltonella defendens]|uniref:tRNA pseudouridine(38-40) synthase TruA n=1 Tax=Candidatus Williamhamiltonella defendens TaxID=138072 RepID=UPI00130ED24C|nr:tRNA pseudouridine(38-40) synthase TruA [Candidatus Hamiltonella defensa]
MPIFKLPTLSSGLTHKIALAIEYNGYRYYGWQRQEHVPSIQRCLEHALSKIANESITVCCAGRTDAGVHATAQVIHFLTTAVRKEVSWIMGVNTYLPPDITVLWAKKVEKDFHARFSATARRYRYLIFNNHHRPALFSEGVAHYSIALDENKMERAAQCLLGENDFSSFRAAQCQSKTPWRYVHHLKVSRFGGYYIMVDIKANAFLHHMVRNIVGSLIEVGIGRQHEHWIAQLLALKDRTQAAVTAKASGLYLVSVDYPSHFSLPYLPLGPLFYT